MKKAIFLALWAATTAMATAQDLVNLRMDREELGLRGNVETLDEDNFYRKDYFRDDWSQRKWFRSDLRSLLQEGEGHVYQFASNGKLKKVTYTSKGKEVASTECKYARNGRISSFLGEGYKMEAKYDGNSALIDIFAETHNYNNVSNLEHADLTTAKYSIDYPFAFSCRQTLNDEGMPLRSVYLNVDSTIASEVVYTYSFNGKIAQEHIKNYSNGSKIADEMIRNYTYDGDGNLIARRLTSKALNESYTYQNNEHGDCIEMKVERTYGTDTYTYNYDYDQQGNWTLRLTFKNGDFEHATLRSIQYSKESKAKTGKNADAVAPADGDANYNDYEAATAHNAAVVANKQETARLKNEQTAKASEKKISKRAERKTMEKQAKEMKKEAGMTAREKAKRQIKKEKKDAKAAKKTMTKQAKKEAKEVRKAAEQMAKEEARTQKNAAKEARKVAEKQAEQDAAAAEKKAREEAKAEAKQTKIDAKKAEKATRKAAKADRKAAAKRAKEIQKQRQRQAKEEAKAAEKAAKEQAKMDAKAVKAAAKAAEHEARKAAKATEKEARRKVKQ
ncbi:MAG: hypothetical protein SPJ13_06065 [Bacteroidales bacterium]|nr:hypothetical protein [Bacteroidales bacterium]